MESSVFKSSEYYQYCCLDSSIAHVDKNDIDKKNCLWSVAKIRPFKKFKLQSCLYFTVNRSGMRIYYIFV